MAELLAEEGIGKDKAALVQIMQQEVGVGEGGGGGAGTPLVWVLARRLSEGWRATEEA